MSWYICGRCGKDTPYLTLDMCTPCLSLLDNLKEGDPVHWRHGKGWAKGTFVRKLKPGSFEVRNSRGMRFVRRGIYLPSEMA